MVEIELFFSRLFQFFMAENFQLVYSMLYINREMKIFHIKIPRSDI